MHNNSTEGKRIELYRSNISTSNGHCEYKSKVNSKLGHIW